MQIVTASDRNYIPGVLVLIASAARHNPQAEFSVLAVDWEAADFERLAALARHLGITITPLPLRQSDFGTLRTARAHLTVAAFARLLIPGLMPEAERVLYMDCDMVVTGSLAPAWDADLGDALVAAVSCPSPAPEALELLRCAEGSYVNSGFLLMNLAQWRAEKIAEHCLDALTKAPETVLGRDEVAINRFCAGRIRYLPGRFNIYATQFLHQTQLCPPAQIRVLHFTVTKKPWIRESTFSPVWYAEAAPVIAATGLPMVPERGGLLERLKRLNQRRKLWQARYAFGQGRRRYLRQHLPYKAWSENYSLAP